MNLPDYDDDQDGMFSPTMVPDFKSHDERDAYFKEHAEYFTVVKGQTGVPVRDEAPDLASAIKLAKTKITIGGGRYMIYAVIGGQSAFVQAVQ